ncbi:hypothetical protein ACO0K2_05925 [Undibacterium sp. MH2W]|uniref:hypothetical protein n=1 Tax=Undibacterium sp. MH2W TaxID=3413044 RepID=UPI003BF41446
MSTFSGESSRTLFQAKSADAHWIPAFAGMTGIGCNQSLEVKTTQPFPPSSPAQAGDPVVREHLQR